MNKWKWLCCVLRFNIQEMVLILLLKLIYIDFFNGLDEEIHKLENHPKNLNRIYKMTKNVEINSIKTQKNTWTWTLNKILIVFDITCKHVEQGIVLKTKSSTLLCKNVLKK